MDVVEQAKSLPLAGFKIFGYQLTFLLFKSERGEEVNSHTGTLMCSILGMDALAHNIYSSLDYTHLFFTIPISQTGSLYPEHQSVVRQSWSAYRFGLIRKKYEVQYIMKKKNAYLTTTTVCVPR